MIYFVGIPEKKVYIYILYPSKCYSRQLVRCEQRNGAKGQVASNPHLVKLGVHRQSEERRDLQTDRKLHVLDDQFPRAGK